MQYYQKIKNIREDRDIKQYVLAKKLNVNRKTYSLYENGMRSFPLNKLSIILKEFNISLDYLLELTDIETYDNLGDIDISIIRENFKKYRIIYGLSQKELGKLINISQQTISAYENGIIKIPIDAIRLFSDKLNISSDTLTGRTNIKIELNNKIKM